MTQPRRGSATLLGVKLAGLAVGGVVLMRFAFQQAEATGQGTLWLAAAAIVPVFIGIFGWMVRDSGNLRELTGRYNMTDKKVEKLDDGQERIFRELGAGKEFRDNLSERLARMQEDIAQQDQFRHDLRDELSPKLANSQLAAFEKIDRLEERIRELERSVDRRGE